MHVATVVARRSRCVRRYGAVIVDDRNRVAAIGHNGPPADLAGTLEGSCVDWCPHAQERTEDHSGYGTCVSIHAETNSIIRLSNRNALLEGTIYVSGLVCWDCAKIIANSGLRRVVMLDDGATYRSSDEATRVMLHSGIIVDVMLKDTMPWD